MSLGWLERRENASMRYPTEQMKNLESQNLSVDVSELHEI